MTAQENKTLEKVLTEVEKLNSRVTSIERKINFASGGIFMLAGIIGFFSDKIRGLFS